MSSETVVIDRQPLYIGIDVGTGSVRAALVQKDGSLVSTSSQEIKTWRSPTDHRIYEQSATDVWCKICAAVKECLSGAAAIGDEVSPSDLVKRIHGIGFDATCSLTVTDIEGKGITVTQGPQLGEYGERNIVLWADHRAEKEAESINATGSAVLDYVGGKISLEMEIPKILWLKKHMRRELFSQCQFFDLPDYLTYRATGDTSRSCCSLTCKCSYVSIVARAEKQGSTPPITTPQPNSGWNDNFFHAIGLSELVKRGYGQIGPIDANGNKILTAGMPVGKGLSKRAADELGLTEGTPVGSGLIDAYAGWLGTVGARCFTESGSKEPSPNLDEAKHRLAVVAGTSTCHIVQSRGGIFVDGVWGPYKDSIFPGWWMNEGGQSSTGQLIEHIITTHPAYYELCEKSRTLGLDNYEVLHDRLEFMRTEEKVGSYTELTKDLHVYPDFHGNRSPIADPRMRGSIVGLDLDASLSSLARLYYATLTSIALQTRSIIETLNSKGHEVEKLYVSGSQAKNPLLMKLLANGCHGQTGTVKGVVITSSDMEQGEKQTGVSAVVLGAAMLGRMAHEVGSSANEMKDEHVASLLWSIMTEMTPSGAFIAAEDNARSRRERRILEAKYQIFLETVEMQKKWRTLIQQAIQE